VLAFLRENEISVEGRKIRIYETRRYGLEMRIYTEPMEYVSSRISFRETSRDETQRYGTRGHHTIKIPMYVHINESDLENRDERDFLISTLKDNLSPYKK